jgi:membrane-associated protease RseP (regulator of RpoE activity)
LIVAAIAASGHRVELGWLSGSLMPVRFESFDSDKLNLLLSDMLFINIFWGLVNLLPVYPLDGGQIARELLELASGPDGVRQSLWFSVICAAVVAILAFTKLDDKYLAIFFAYLAYTSYATLQAHFGPGGGMGK